MERNCNRQAKVKPPPCGRQQGYERQALRTRSAFSAVEKRKIVEKSLDGGFYRDKNHAIIRQPYMIKQDRKVTDRDDKQRGHAGTDQADDPCTDILH